MPEAYKSTKPLSSVATLRPAASRRSTRIGIATGSSERKRTTPSSTVSSNVLPWASVRRTRDPLAGVLDSAAGPEPVISPVPSEIRPRETTRRQVPDAATPSHGEYVPPVRIFMGHEHGPLPLLRPCRTAVGVAGDVPELALGSTPLLHEPDRVRQDSKRDKPALRSLQAWTIQPLTDGVLWRMRHGGSLGDGFGFAPRPSLPDSVVCRPQAGIHSRLPAHWRPRGTAGTQEQRSDLSGLKPGCEVGGARSLGTGGMLPPNGLDG